MKRVLRTLSIAALLVLGGRAFGASAEDQRQDAHRRALRARHGVEAGQAQATPAREALDAEDAWQALLAGNKRHVLGKPRVTSASTRQAAPQALVLDCSDDPTDPATLFDQPSSELLVLREPGNLAGAPTIASIEHAVSVRGTTLIVLLGHEGCTRMTDAARGEPAASSSLAAIHERLAAVLAPLVQSGLRGEELVHRAVHDNVHRSAAQLLTSSPLVAQAVRAGALRIVEAVHDPARGTVEARSTARGRVLTVSEATNPEPPSPKEHTHD